MFYSIIFPNSFFPRRVPAHMRYISPAEQFDHLNSLFNRWLHSSSTPELFYTFFTAFLYALSRVNIPVVIDYILKNRINIGYNWLLIFIFLCFVKTYHPDKYGRRPNVDVVLPEWLWNLCEIFNNKDFKKASREERESKIQEIFRDARGEMGSDILELLREILEAWESMECGGLRRCVKHSGLFQDAEFVERDF